GLQPVIEFRSGLIASLDVEFMGSLADSFFERQRLGRRFFCVGGCRHKDQPPAITVSQTLPRRKAERKKGVASRGSVLLPLTVKKGSAKFSRRKSRTVPGATSICEDCSDKSVHLPGADGLEFVGVVRMEQEML